MPNIEFHGLPDNEAEALRQRVKRLFVGELAPLEGEYITDIIPSRAQDAQDRPNLI